MDGGRATARRHRFRLAQSCDITARAAVVMVTSVAVGLIASAYHWSTACCSNRLPRLRRSAPMIASSDRSRAKSLRVAALRRSSVCCGVSGRAAAAGVAGLAAAGLGAAAADGGAAAGSTGAGAGLAGTGDVAPVGAAVRGAGAGAGLAAGAAFFGTGAGAGLAAGAAFFGAAAGTSLAAGAAFFGAAARALAVADDFADAAALAGVGLRDGGLFFAAAELFADEAFFATATFFDRVALLPDFFGFPWGRVFSAALL